MEQVGGEASPSRKPRPRGSCATPSAGDTPATPPNIFGDEQLRTISREIAEKVKANTSIDWNIKQSARAKLIVVVKRTLNKSGYPPE